MEINVIRIDYDRWEVRVRTLPFPRWRWLPRRLRFGLLLYAADRRIDAISYADWLAKPLDRSEREDYTINHVSL